MAAVERRGQLRLYRALLVLYPQSFRRDYGDAMAQLHTDLLREAGAKVWRRAVVDLCTSVITQRTEAAMSMSPAARVITLAAVGVGASLAVIGIGGGGVVVVIAVFVVALLFTQRRSLAALAGERVSLRAALTQAWWAPVAALLGAAMLAAGVGTIFEAHNLGGRIVGSSLLLAFGAAMLLGLLRRPHAREAGNTLVLIATVPAFPFFWLVVPTVAALVVWVGVLTSGYREEPALHPTPSR